MKVIIAGGRDFDDYKFLCYFCNKVLKDCQEIEIVSGTANGADKLGERFAKDNGYLLKQFPANWDLFGKSAGYKRNEQMAEYSDFLIAFWDGKSKGTRHMIEIAKKNNLTVKVCHY